MAEIDLTHSTEQNPWVEFEGLENSDEVLRRKGRALAKLLVDIAHVNADELVEIENSLGGKTEGVRYQLLLEFSIFYFSYLDRMMPLPRSQGIVFCEALFYAIILELAKLVNPQQPQRSHMNALISNFNERLPTYESISLKDAFTHMSRRLFEAIARRPLIDMMSAANSEYPKVDPLVLVPWFAEVFIAAVDYLQLEKLYGLSSAPRAQD